MNNEKNCVLVTGANGFIGNSLIRRILDLNKYDKVIGIDIHSESKITGVKNFIYVCGDLLKHESFNELKLYDIGTIYHLAANANVPLAIKEPIMDFTVNALGTLKILEFAREMSVEQLIYSSTVSIFDQSNSLPISETSRVKVSSPYGASKLAGESYCYAYHRTYGLNTKIARLFNVYGPGMKKHFIYDMINKINSSKKELVVLGDGKQTRDYLFIDDIIEGLLVITDKGKAGEDYNLSSGIETNILEVVEILISLMERNDLSIKLTMESWPGDIKKWFADISKIKEIGFKPKVDLKNGLKKTVMEILQNEK